MYSLKNKTMRKRIFTLCFALSAIASAAQAQVAINATNFPDENFRNWLLDSENINGYGADGTLTATEIADIKDIGIGNKNIADLTGIGNFTALEWLNCAENQLTSLDLSNNTALLGLTCPYNQITKLDLSKNTALIQLFITGNPLTSLEVTDNLQRLYCGKQDITPINFGQFTKLNALSINDVDMSSIDVSSLKELTYLQVHYTKIASLDVSNNKKLTTLLCDNNLLTELIVRNFEFLTEIDASDNPELTILNCDGNPLTKFKVSGCTALKKIQCRNTTLASLDVSGLTALETLYCGLNKLTALNASSCTALKELDCCNNFLRGENMDDMLNNLPTVTNSELFVYKEEASDGNLMTPEQVATAISKGWHPKYWNDQGWEDYEGVTSGIETIANSPLTIGNCYDLNGRKVSTIQPFNLSSLPKGVYISNGRKVVVK